MIYIYKPITTCVCIQSDISCMHTDRPILIYTSLYRIIIRLYNSIYKPIIQQQAILHTHAILHARAHVHAYKAIYPACIQIVDTDSQCLYLMVEFHFCTHEFWNVTYDSQRCFQYSLLAYSPSLTLFFGEINRWRCAML